MMFPRRQLFALCLALTLIFCACSAMAGTNAPELNGETEGIDCSTALADGVYAPDQFSWSGGSGRIQIFCDQVTVSDGRATATLRFSSENIGYVKAAGSKYTPDVIGGNSTVEIPVKLNGNNEIIGMTTAMSAAHEITYTIYVYIQAADVSALQSADADAPVIPGLNYESTMELRHAKLARVYRYQGGFTVIEVEGVGRYLTVPEGSETGAGLDETAELVFLPVKSAYVASEDALRLIDSIAIDESRDAVKAIGVENVELSRLKAENLSDCGRFDAPDYAALLKLGCDFAIMPADFAENESDGRATELSEVRSRMDLLDIPVFVDRSADEESEEARLEWIKIYGVLLGCEREADACIQALKD